MYITNKEGYRLDFIYSSHDRFLEDLDIFISENHIFKVSAVNSTDLLDVVSGHLLYWCYEKYEDNSQAALIFDDLFRNNVQINGLIEIGDSTPEMILYKFNGVSVYDQLTDENVLPKQTHNTIEIKLDNHGILFLTIEEFEGMGGEITFPEDENDELSFDFFRSGDVYFFMTDYDENSMREYLIKCIDEINKIYASLDICLIEFYEP
jgi:hypothetical protein